MSEHGICILRIYPYRLLAVDARHVIPLAKVANAATRRDYRIARQLRQLSTSNQQHGSRLTAPPRAVIAVTTVVIRLSLTSPLSPRRLTNSRP
jgi:hypothetical protein